MQYSNITKLNLKNRGPQEASLRIFLNVVFLSRRGNRYLSGASTSTNETNSSEEELSRDLKLTKEKAEKKVEEEEKEEEDEEEEEKKKEKEAKEKEEEQGKRRKKKKRRKNRKMM